MKYMLGVDVGTTNVKAVLYTYAGKEVMQSADSYALFTDQLGTATQDIEAIKEATFKVIQEIVKKCTLERINISFLSLSTAMHSVLPISQDGTPLMPVITWADRRAEPYTEKLKNKEDILEIYHRTGTPIHSMSPFVKLLWLQNEHPEIFEQTYKFIDIKSYLMHELVGEYVLDYSLANGTGLFNMYTFDWDAEALEMARISADQLPKLAPTTTVFRDLKSNIAIDLDLPSDFPIVIGASDGCLANLGVDAIHSEKLALTIGTSGAIRTGVKQPLTDPQGQSFCYYLATNTWIIGGPVNNGGAVLDWAKENILLTTTTYSEMMHLIEEAPLGADDLFFYPYLMGERAPFWTEKIKSTFFGLTLHHKKSHMLRAVLEGINLNLYTVYQTIVKMLHHETTQIQVTGGFTRSTTWLQMLADIFGIELVLTNVHENGCLGAVILGLYALGEIETLDVASTFIKQEKIVYPNLEKHMLYRKHFEKYQKINTKLLSIYEVEGN